jgi:2-polyprenyl-3-methyl-5-hydroxy-6-metoxy-1,4-benzoquinol methylase
MNYNEEKSWMKMYRHLAKSGDDHQWPSETLVRIMKGNFIPNINLDYSGKKVLDVGCGNGNNLLFLGSLGLKLFGTEIEQSICDDTMKRLNWFLITGIK